MPRKGAKLQAYAVNRHKRKRLARTSRSQCERFGFRKTMLRSLDELELGGHLPSYKELKHLFDSEDEMIAHCLEKEIFDCPKNCPRCKHELKPPSKKHTVRCRKVECAHTCPTVCQRCESDELHIALDASQQANKAECPDCAWAWRPGLEFEQSVFKNSFVQGCKLPKNEVMHCLWLWLNKVPSSTTASMLVWNDATASDWYKFFRKMASQMLDHDKEENMLGGYDDNGEPIIVEIDETKMGKRKHNKGRRVNASWVIGMVERTKQRRCAWVVVEKRDAGVCTSVQLSENLLNQVLSCTLTCGEDTTQSAKWD